MKFLLGHGYSRSVSCNHLFEAKRLQLVAIDIYMMANNRTYVSELIDVMFSDRNSEIGMINYALP